MYVGFVFVVEELVDGVVDFVEFGCDVDLVFGCDYWLLCGRLEEGSG